MIRMCWMWGLPCGNPRCSCCGQGRSCLVELELRNSEITVYNWILFPHVWFRSHPETLCTPFYYIIYSSLDERGCRDQMMPKWNSPIQTPPLTYLWHQKYAYSSCKSSMKASATNPEELESNFSSFRCMPLQQRTRRFQLKNSRLTKVRKETPEIQRLPTFRVMVARISSGCVSF